MIGSPSRGCIHYVLNNRHDDDRQPVLIHVGDDVQNLWKLGELGPSSCMNRNRTRVPAKLTSLDSSCRTIRIDTLAPFIFHLLGRLLLLITIVTVVGGIGRLRIRREYRKWMRVTATTTMTRTRQMGLLFLPAFAHASFGLWFGLARPLLFSSPFQLRRRLPLASEYEHYNAE